MTVYTKTIEEEFSVYDEPFLRKACNVANGIYKAIRNHQYKQGLRNTIAVDFCCALSILNYSIDEIIDIVDKFKRHGWLDANQYTDFIHRVERLDPYLSNRWYLDWENYWFDPDNWENCNKDSIYTDWFGFTFEKKD